MDADWHSFCQAIYKGIKGQEWEALCYHYNKLHQAAGAKKPGDSQKAKALWTMKAIRSRDDEIYDPARKNDIQGMNGLWGRTPETPGGSISEGVSMSGNHP